jgi:2-dehydropantoate 2-reductase
VRTVVVLGAGAVGSLLGARLASSGASVLLVGRPEHVRAIQADGLRVEGIDPGTFPLRAATGLASGTAADLILLTVKSFDLASAAVELARAMPPTPTVLLGNGLGIEETAARALREGGWERTGPWLVRAVHSVPATLVRPGTVRATGTGEVVFPLPGSVGEASNAVDLAVEVFSRARFTVRTTADFPLEIWRKAVVNAAVNPVTAIRGVANGGLSTGPAREEALALLGEAVRVAQRSGVDLSLEVSTADFDRIVRATAENRSSMLQDVDHGRPTELDSISGEILRRGRRLGLSLPATSRAIEEVRRRLDERSRSAQR